MTTFALIAAACGAGLLLLAALLPGRRTRRAAAAATAAEAGAIARVETLLQGLSAAQARSLTLLTEEIAALRAEVDWLSGERKIDEAIAMARMGEAPEAIGAALDLSPEDAAAIAALRRH